MSGVVGWESNFNSLKGVSSYFPSEQIALLRQSYLFGPKQDVYTFYSNPIIYAMSVAGLITTTFGFVISRREKHWKYLLVIALFGWFVSKGTNPPFGYSVYQYLFSKIPQTMLFRNPYEKFGLVWLIPYSIFFSLGISALFDTKKVYGRIIARLVLLVVFTILVWPMWSGRIFADDVHIRVPDYYEEVNGFLNRDKSHSRLLMLPMIAGDAVVYNWDGGNYHGVEPSEYLFDKPSVSKISRSNKYADDKYIKLRESFLEDEKYLKILTEVNIKYLILHHDYAEKVAKAEEVEQIQTKLMESEDIKLVRRVGELSVFEYLRNSNPKHIIVDGNNPPSIVSEKISNSSYRVDIKDSTEPFTLIFKESFNDMWEARILDEKVVDHFMVYDYANGWQVGREGSYTIDIIFNAWP
jgi:hypothetical protein